MFEAASASWPGSTSEALHCAPGRRQSSVTGPVRGAPAGLDAVAPSRAPWLDEQADVRDSRELGAVVKAVVDGVVVAVALPGLTGLARGLVTPPLPGEEPDSRRAWSTSRSPRSSSRSALTVTPFIFFLIMFISFSSLEEGETGGSLRLDSRRGEAKLRAGKANPLAEAHLLTLPSAILRAACASWSSRLSWSSRREASLPLQPEKATRQSRNVLRA